MESCPRGDYARERNKERNKDRGGVSGRWGKTGGGRRRVSERRQKIERWKGGALRRAVGQRGLGGEGFSVAR